MGKSQMDLIGELTKSLVGVSVEEETPQDLPEEGVDTTEGAAGLAVEMPEEGEGAPVTVPPTEAAISPSEAALRERLAAAEAKLAMLEKPAETEPAPKKDTPLPPILDENELKAILEDGDPKALNNALAKAATISYNAVMGQLPTIIAHLVKQEITDKSDVEKFWEANKDLVDVSQYLMVEVEETQRKNPKLSREELLDKAVTNFRQKIGRPKVSTPPVVEPRESPSGQPTSAGGKSGGPTPPPKAEVVHGKKGSQEDYIAALFKDLK